MRNIFSIIIIIAAIASFVLVVQPQYKEIQALQSKSSELEEVLSNARRLQSLRDGLLERRNELSDADMARLEKMVPENVDNVKLILELQSIVNQYDLEIETASANKEGESEGSEGASESEASFVDVNSRDYGIIAIDFDITGDYFDFLAFLRDLEQNLRITDVRSLGFSSADGGDFSFQVTLETYWLKDNI